MRRPENLFSKAKASKKTNFRDSEKGLCFFTMENKGSMKLIPSQELCFQHPKYVKRPIFAIAKKAFVFSRLRTRDREMLNMVNNSLDLPGWAISLVSAIWGGFSTKINHSRFPLRQFPGQP